MRIQLDQIRTLLLSSPPDFPDENEVYIDDGTNTTSGAAGWRIYRDGQWHDLGMQEITGLLIDGGSLY